MDEPFGAIDPKNRKELQELISKLSKEEKKTVVFVTHDIEEAILLADRIIFMSDKTIKADIKVDFHYPRKKEALIGDKKYLSLHNELMKLFYENIAQKIGDEVTI